jgi:dienelactone hydrolase
MRLARPALVLTMLASLVAAGAASADPLPGLGVDTQCFAHTTRIDPQPDASGHPTNPAWIQRDAVNQYCATLRLRDQAASPAYGKANLTLGAELMAARMQEQVADGPGHVKGGVTPLVPGSQAADAMRSIPDWERLTGGKATRISFTSSDGAKLYGHLWTPPKSVAKPAAGYPGIVITDGSVQAFEQLYYWAAQGLAQYGYQVLTYDVQGQGDSDLLPASCTSPSSCPGVPYQQNYNFYQGAEDALSWFDSAKNPGFGSLDGSRLGIAGHSLGAAAVSWVGQCDSRVKTLVAWDDLTTVDPKQCASNVKIPAAFRAKSLHTPALATANDYEFNVQPATSVPNPHGDTNGGGIAGDGGYQQLAKAGVDVERVSFRNGTHLTYTYIPLVLPSNELSERFAFYYTLAWFDQYLRDGSNPYTSQSAYDRLTSLGKYDDSADRNSRGAVSIGTGVFDPTAAAANPTDDRAGNVPYAVKGISIPDSLSFYYYSQYRLTDPRSGRVRSCTDMIAGCPKTQPAIP